MTARTATPPRAAARVSKPWSAVGADSLLGEDGADTLLGGAQNDRIFGGFGANAGGFQEAGDDALWGSAGSDRFVFTGASGSNSIQDFRSQDGDRVVLDRAAFEEGITLAWILDNAVTFTKTGAVIALSATDQFRLERPADARGPCALQDMSWHAGSR